jgi:hypothetical protein
MRYTLELFGDDIIKVCKNSNFTEYKEFVKKLFNHNGPGYQLREPILNIIDDNLVITWKRKNQVLYTLSFNNNFTLCKFNKPEFETQYVLNDSLGWDKFITQFNLILYPLIVSANNYDLYKYVDAKCIYDCAWQLYGITILNDFGPFIKGEKFDFALEIIDSNVTTDKMEIVLSAIKEDYFANTHKKMDEIKGFTLTNLQDKELKVEWRYEEDN